MSPPNEECRPIPGPARKTTPTVDGGEPIAGHRQAFHPRAFRRGLRHANVEDAEYRVAVELCEFAGIDRPIVWPSNAILAEACGMTPRAVVRILRRLEAKGVIVCAARSKGGRGNTTHWRLVVRPPETMTGGSLFQNGNDDPRVTVSARKTMTYTAINHDPDGTKTMTRGSPEVVIEAGIEGGGARATPESATHEPGPSRADPPPIRSANSKSANSEAPMWFRGPYGPRCRGHVNHPDPPKCRGCARAREADQAERDADHDRRAAEDARVRAGIQACPDCDDYGRLDDLTDCPRHANFRQRRVS